MELVVYSQYYRTSTPERQLEIDECLRRNLNHPGISRMVLFCESDAPPVPQGTVPVEVVTSDERITYAEWFRWVQRQRSGIGLLLNAYMYMDEGLEQLGRTFDRPDVFLALTRYNPGKTGFHLNDYPHWTQEVWGVRAVAELPKSLLGASSYPWNKSYIHNEICNYGLSIRKTFLQTGTAKAPKHHKKDQITKYSKSLIKQCRQEIEKLYLNLHSNVSNDSIPKARESQARPPTLKMTQTKSATDPNPNE